MRKFLILCLLFVSASCGSGVGKTEISEKQKKQIIDSIYRSDFNKNSTEIRCPKCNGLGKVELSTGQRTVLGLLTLGPGFLITTDVCPYCKGYGVIRIKKLANESESDTIKIKTRIND